MTLMALARRICMTRMLNVGTMYEPLAFRVREVSDPSPATNCVSLIPKAPIYQETLAPRTFSSRRAWRKISSIRTYSLTGGGVGNVCERFQVDVILPLFKTSLYSLARVRAQSTVYYPDKSRRWHKRWRQPRNLAPLIRQE